jgi:hypothetical protein
MENSAFPTLGSLTFLIWVEWIIYNKLILFLIYYFLITSSYFVVTQMAHKLLNFGENAFCLRPLAAHDTSYPTLSFVVIRE